MKRLVIIRPQPGNARTAALASSQGLIGIAMPLQDHEPVAWQKPEGEFDGLLIGSANALRFPSPMFDDTLHLPVYAVGEATAAMAESSGYTVALAGTGGLQAVIDALPADKPLRLLRIGGERRVPLDLPEHIEIVDRAVYRMIDCDMTSGQAKLLRMPCCVAVHSVGALDNFRRNCSELNINPAMISLLCLGPRIAAAAGEGWAEVAAASAPNDAALLELAYQMCNKPA